VASRKRLRKNQPHSAARSLFWVEHPFRPLLAGAALQDSRSSPSAPPVRQRISRSAGGAVSGVEVRLPPIEGSGVFATHSFHAWERTRRVNVVREITADAPLREDAGERRNHLDYPDDKVILFGIPDRHINHGRDPNAYLLHGRGEVFVVAGRDIAAGEEITCDYSVNITGAAAGRADAEARGVVALLSGTPSDCRRSVSANISRSSQNRLCGSIGSGLPQQVAEAGWPLADADLVRPTAL
jgi:hypothetical protein